MTSGIDNSNDTVMGFLSGHRWHTYASAALIATLFSFVFISDGFGGYRADALLLVMSRGQTGSSAREIAENVVSLSKTDAFHSAFFRDVESVPSFMAKEAPDDLSNDTKRVRFDKLVSFHVSDTGSTILVRGFSNDRDDASAISRSASLSLSRYAARYYNIQEEADFRIVDGPEISNESSGMPVRLSVSVAIGIVVAAIFSILVSFVTAIVSSIKTSSVTASVSHFSADMFLPKRPASTLLSNVDVVDVLDRVPDRQTSEPTDMASNRESQSAGEKSQPIETSVRKSATTATVSTKKATAPLDLPMYSDEEARFLQEFSFEPFTEGTEETSSTDDLPDDSALPDVASEVTDSIAVSDVDTVETEALPSPTKEEYQRRLNQLLRG